MGQELFRGCKEKPGLRRLRQGFYMRNTLAGFRGPEEGARRRCASRAAFSAPPKPRRERSHTDDV